MLIKSLTMQNFIPYYGIQTIEFPTSPQSNVLVIFGENTHGKTSVLNAFRWVFYGEAINKGNPIPLENILNRKARSEGTQSGSVVISFEHEESQFKLERFFDLDSQPQSSRALYINGDLQPDQDFDKWIQRIVPKETARFFLFDGELLKEYEELLVEGSAASKKIKRSIEDILGVPSLQMAINNMVPVLRNLRHASASATQTESATQEAQKQISVFSESIQKNVESLKKLEDQYFLDEQELSDISAVVNDTREQQTQSEELSQLLAKQNGLTTSINEIEREIVEARSTLWKSVLSDWAAALSEGHSNKIEEYENKRSKIEELKFEIKNLRQLNTDRLCPSCNQTIPVDLDIEIQIIEKSRMLDDLDASQIDISEIQGWNQLTHMLNRDTFPLSKLREKTESLGSKIFDQDRMKKEISDLRKSLSNFDSGKMENLIRQQEALKHALAMTDKSISEIKTKISSEEDHRRKLEAQIEVSGGSKAKVSIARVQSAEKIDKIFKRALDILRENLKQTVQARAAEAFKSMTTRPDHYVDLRITETYGMEIISNTGDVVPSRSAGAEQIVALSLIDGLNRTGKAAGPVIMDTPFGRLDKTHRSNILNYLPQSARQLVVFVHSGELERNDETMMSIKSRVGAEYQIRPKSADESILEPL